MEGVQRLTQEPEIRTLSSSVVYSDNWCRFRRDEIERADGSKGTYAVVERDDFALIIPAENGGFHLVEEYRHPLGRRGWSFPQGSFPKGQTGPPEAPARTGLAPGAGAARGGAAPPREARRGARHVRPVRRALAGHGAHPGRA